MIDPLFWLGLSLLLVAASLTAVLIAAVPALQEIARAARSIEKLADTLSRELPPTLEAIRLTGLEITELTDDVSDGVESATQIVKQVDQSIGSAKQQVKKAQITTKSLFTGLNAAWKTFTRPSNTQPPNTRSTTRLNPSQKTELIGPGRGPAPTSHQSPSYTSDPYRDYPNDPYYRSDTGSPPLPPRFEDVEQTDDPP